MDPLGITVEQKLARLASESWGIVDREELLAAGVSATQVRDRVRKGVLIREFDGVYRVGHRAPSVEAHYLGPFGRAGRARC